MEFSFNKWNVPLIQEPNELMKKLQVLDVLGYATIYVKT